MKKFFPNLVYLLIGMPLGILYFVVLITGYALGAGLAITIIGIPILVSMIFVTYMLGDLERVTTSKFLGLKIPKPEARPARTNSARSILTEQLRNMDFWKELAYLLVKMPLGVVTFTIALTLVILTLSLIAAPLIVTFLPGTDFMVANGVRVDTMNEALFCLAAGVMIGALSMPILNGLAWAHGKITMWALGKADNE